MNWLNALDKLFKAKDIYDKAKEVKKLHDYGKKLDPKKLTWDDLKYFKNKQMETATKQAREAEAAADAALATKVVWPRSNATDKFAAAMRTSTRHGHASSQTKAAVSLYRRALLEYDRALQGIVSDLEAKQKQLPEKISMAKALHDYCDVLHDAFMACAKVPNPTGTAMNAQFFSLAQDAQQLAGITSTLQTKFKKIQEKNAAAIAEGKSLIADNKLWIQWAGRDATSAPGMIKRNESARRPRR